jgi:hypothetical protein
MEEQEITIGLGSYVGVTKGETLVTGYINGIKLYGGVVERVSFDEVEYWFYLDQGWKIVELGEGEADA